MPCYGNNNDGIMPFTKKVVCRFQKIKYKNLSQTKQLSQKGNQDNQWYDAVCIIRRYYCLNRDVIGENAFQPEIVLRNFEYLSLYLWRERKKNIFWVTYLFFAFLR